MSMTNNNFNTNNSSSSNYDVLPKQFINYINYELTLFEKITNKKFFFNILSNDRFELKVSSKSKEEKDYDDNRSKYQIVYRANNIYQFIKRLFMIREHLTKNFIVLKYVNVVYNTSPIKNNKLN